MVKQIFISYLLLLFVSQPILSQKNKIRIHPKDSPLSSPQEDLYTKILPQFQGKKVALITNPSGIGSNPDRIKEELQKNKINLELLIGLEHGFFGLEEDFSSSPVTNDPTFNVPVYHIYKLKTDELRKVVSMVDFIIFDVQDMGMRCYTYVSVIKRVLEVIPDKNTPFIILDHPNPALHLGPRGDFMQKDLENFAGEFPTLVLSGLTIAESAVMYNDDVLMGRVKVIPIWLTQYKRDMLWEETGVPWYTPSPNLPLLENARNYMALVFLEGINVSVGRGTQAPFVYFGASYMNQPDKLAIEIEKTYDNGKESKDVYFTPAYFKPYFGPCKGQICKGLRMNLVNEKYDPIRLSYAIISSIKKLYPNDFKWNKGKNHGIDLLWGNDGFRTSIDKGLDYNAFHSTFDDKEKQEKVRLKKYYYYSEK